MITWRTAATATAVAVLGLTATLAPAHAAGGYALLTKKQIQTIVTDPSLAPKGLGPTTKNLFVWFTKDRPVMCWDATGAMVTLPAAPGGLIGYELKASNTVAGPAIYQYPTWKQAQAAAKKLSTYVCPDNAKWRPDAGAPAIDVSQGSDILKPMYLGPGFESSNTLIDDGTKLVEARCLRQVGNVVISIEGTTTPQRLDALTTWCVKAVNRAATLYYNAAYGDT